MFNEKIWPDFTQLPTEKNPTMRINAIEPEKTFLLDGFEITPVPVTHPNNAMGFIISNSKSTVLFTADTGPTERIWEMAAKLKNLKAIFTEVSFPNHLQKVADISDHHTPKTMKLEMAKMPKDIPIVLTHLKPNYRQEIMAEIAGWNDARIKVLEKDGEVFNF